MTSSTESRSPASVDGGSATAAAGPARSTIALTTGTTTAPASGKPLDVPRTLGIPFFIETSLLVRRGAERRTRPPHQSRCADHISEPPGATPDREPRGRADDAHRPGPAAP